MPPKRKPQSSEEPATPLRKQKRPKFSEFIEYDARKTPPPLPPSNPSPTKPPRFVLSSTPTARGNIRKLHLVNDENSPFQSNPNEVEKPSLLFSNNKRATNALGVDKDSKKDVYDIPESEDDLQKALPPGATTKGSSNGLSSAKTLSPRQRHTISRIPTKVSTRSSTAGKAHDAPSAFAESEFDKPEGSEPDVPQTPSRRGRGRRRGGATASISSRKVPEEAPVLPVRPKRAEPKTSALAEHHDPGEPQGELEAHNDSPRKRGRPRGRPRGRATGRHLASRAPENKKPAAVSVAQSPLPNEIQIENGQQPSTGQSSPADVIAVKSSITVVANPVAFSGAVSETGVKMLKEYIIGKMNGRNLVNGTKRVVGFEEEYGHVFHLLEQTVVAGEGNSMLVIGPRGVGKTTLVESAISELQAEHAGEFHVVRLNGFLQTDDKLATREIWRQLGVEMELDAEGGQPKTTNFADTLTSILALLSHPTELNPDEHRNSRNGTNPTTAFLQKPTTTSLSVVFVLDEFDLFASHPRQMLLYNLFDIAQARKAPIAVIGLTARIDVVESLEKRVKSRFSHRSVHLRLPNSLERFWEIVSKGGLYLDVQELQEKAYRTSTKVGPAEIRYWSQWNQYLESLYESSSAFRSLLKRTYYVSKDVKSFLSTYCLYPISSYISTDTPFLTAEMLLGSSSTSASTTNIASQVQPCHFLRAPENKLHVLPGLSELELALLIAAARLDIICDTDTCNFNMAYEEYKSLTSKVKIQNSITSTPGSGVGGAAGKLWGRQVAMRAWEKLGTYEILVPAVIGGGGAASGGVGREGRMWRVDVGLGEIGKSVPGLNAVMSKWCREI